MPLIFHCRNPLVTLRCTKRVTHVRTIQVLLTPPDEGPRVKGERIKLQDIVNGEFTPKKLNGQWVSADEFLYLNQWNEISLLNLANLAESIMMSNTTYVSHSQLDECQLSPRMNEWHSCTLCYVYLRSISSLSASRPLPQKSMSPQSFSISADRKYLLLGHNIKKMYRHSTLAQYTVFDIVTSESFQLTPKNNNIRQLFPELRDNAWPYLQYASFGPRGHAIVMVYNYNIYYTNGIKSIQTYRITSTGIPGVIFNGIADWLYEGESSILCCIIMLNWLIKNLSWFENWIIFIDFP